jgi:hypothetical protein
MTKTHLQFLSLSVLIVLLNILHIRLWSLQVHAVYVSFAFRSTLSFADLVSFLSFYYIYIYIYKNKDVFAYKCMLYIPWSECKFDSDSYNLVVHSETIRADPMQDRINQTAEFMHLQPYLILNTISTPTLKTISRPT